MAGWVRVLLAVAAVALPAGAEPAGQVADALRWYDPRGCAGGSRRSAAIPVTGDPVEAWKVETRQPVLAPPVHWDGRLYLLCGSGKQRELLALDLFEGRELARRILGSGPPTKPVVWDHRVYLRIAEEEIGEFVVVGSGFNESWRHRPACGPLSDPVIFENEIYVGSAHGLLRLSPGRAKPVWKTVCGPARGRAAVYGDVVCALGEEQVPGYEPSMHLYSYLRSDGSCVAALNVAWYHRGSIPLLDVEGELVFGGGRCYIRAPAPLAAQNGSCPAASLPFGMTRGGARAGEKEISLLDVDGGFTTHRDGLVAFMQGRSKREIVYFTNEGGGTSGHILSDSREQPDLFACEFPPTMLGDIAYFGDWAADVTTHQILWRIPVASLAFPIVPADRMFVAVEAPCVVRAFRERNEGQ